MGVEGGRHISVEHGLLFQLFSQGDKPDTSSLHRDIESAPHTSFVLCYMFQQHIGEMMLQQVGEDKYLQESKAALHFEQNFRDITEPLREVT